MTEIPRRRQLLPWVDWVKVLALLAVISIHNSGSNASAARKGNLRLANWFGVITDIPYMIAVPLFVMVSGTLLLNPDKFRGTGDFLRKRVVRLLPAIVAWNLFYLVFMQYYMGPPLDASEVVRRLLNGQTVAHLYYLWIVLGLSLLSPILIRWLRAASVREQLWGAVGFTLIPTVASATFTLRNAKVGLVETPWTWWFGYVGLFLLGWVLRDVVVAGWRLLLLGLAVLTVQAVLCVQFVHGPSMPVLTQFLPVSYYGFSVVVAAAGAFVVLHSLFRDGGLLGFLVRPSIMRVVSLLSQLSLGIYALHMAVLMVINKYELFGPMVTDGALLVLRWLTATLITIAIVLVMRKVPGLRRIV